MVETRTITIYDKESRVKVKLWDAQINIPDEMGLRPGDLVRISKGYVKSGLDGKPVINLGTYGVIEPVGEDDGSIPDIDSLTITIDDITAPQDSVIVTGRVNSTPRISEFVNPRGEPSKSLQMQISNDSNTRSMRAVIWNVDEQSIPKVFDINAKVRLIGVRIKQANPQYGSGDFEIHGDEGTVLEFPDSSPEINILPVRIVSVGEHTGRGNVNCIGVDKDGRFIHLTIDSALVTDQLEPGAVIECVPSRIFGTSVILSKDDSYIRAIEDNGFPPLEQFETKIKDIRASENPCIIEAIVLQAPNLTDVTTKSGQTVSVADTLVGDDTGEIRLVGWRNQSGIVNKLNVGDRIKILGAPAASSRDGKVEISLKPFSSVKKIS